MKASKVTGCVLQPTFLPWLGYFDLLHQCDVVILLDDVGFSKQSWQQRNRLRSEDGLVFVSVPVKTAGRLGQRIISVEIADAASSRSILGRVESLYRKAPNFAHFFPVLNSAYEEGSSTGYLAELNLRLIRTMCEALDIERTFLRSSELTSTGQRGQKIADLCRLVGVDTYLSPVGAASYLLQDRDHFLDGGVEVRLQNYDHPQYQQQFEPFVSHASVLDLILNEGRSSLDIIASGRRDNTTLDLWRSDQHGRN